MSALGALTSGTEDVVKSINDHRVAKDQLKEANRHIKTMESLALGNELYLRHYKTGSGVKLCLHNESQKHLKKKKNLKKSTKPPSKKN